MATGFYPVIDGKTRKAKANYAVVGGVTKKVTKMYAVVDGKTRLIWGGGGSVSFGKALAMFNEKKIPVVLNNADVTNASTWVVSTRNDTNTSIDTTQIGYAFGKWFVGCNNKNKSALSYSTDGVTFTKCADVGILNNSGQTVAVGSTINAGKMNVGPFTFCDGRLFGRSITVVGSSGAQSGGGGTTYVTYGEFNSSGSLIAQADGYQFNFSSVNSGYGSNGTATEGKFNRTYSNTVYHGGYIYYAYHWRRVNNDKDSDHRYKGIHTIIMERYNIASKTFETVADGFFNVQETTTRLYDSPTIAIHLCGNSILVNFSGANKMFRYDISTKAVTDLTSGNSSYSLLWRRVTENIFVDQYTTPKRVYSYDGTTLTLVTTHSNPVDGTGQTWCGDRNISIYANRAKPTDATAPIILAYTLDGITYTVDNTSLVTPSGAFSTFGNNKSGIFDITLCPATN